MKQIKILLVDDEVRFANMLAKRLTLRGIDCHVCYNGKQALDILAQNKFFLVLLDLHLPDIYGTEVLAEIQKLDARPPVIVLTGHGSEKDREICMNRGAYAFIHKPLSIDKLMSILEQIKELSS